MVTYNRLTVENLEFIRNKAASKSNGVYFIRGIGYRVRDQRVTHYAVNSEILESFGGFNCLVGRYYLQDDGQKKLKSL